MSSFANDDVTEPAESLTLQRRSPYAIQSQLGLLFVGVLHIVSVIISLTYSFIKKLSNCHFNIGRIEDKHV